MHYDEYVFFYKRKLLDYFHFLCSKKYHAIYLRSIHYLSPNIISFVFLFFPKYCFYLATLLYFLAFSLFFIFDGCILFDFDKEYFSEDINMCDPFLDLIGWDITPENRMDVNSLTYFFCCITIIILHDIRFIGNLGYPFTPLFYNSILATLFSIPNYYYTEKHI